MTLSICQRLVKGKEVTNLLPSRTLLDFWRATSISIFLMTQLQAHGPGGNGGNPEPIFTLNNEVKVGLHSLLSHYQTLICGIGDLALGVASTSLSSANMSAPLFGVLKIEPDKAPKGFLQTPLLQSHQIKKQWARSGSPVIRSRGIAVELELAGKIKGSVQQLVCCVRAETGNLIAKQIEQWGQKH